jgi:group I intron endonuclease
MTYVVYKISNNIDDRVYIDSSKQFTKRQQQHLIQLKNNKHHCLHLQNFYNKYSNIQFIFEVLYSFEEQRQCYDQEEILLNSLTNLFNVSKKASGGDLISYHPNIEEIKQKHRSNMKLKMDLGYIPFNGPKFGIDNPNYKHGGNIYKQIFCSSCSCTISISATMCSSCYASTRQGSKNSFYGKKHTRESKIAMGLSRKGIPNLVCSIPIFINNIEYTSLSEASRLLNIHITTISYRLKSSNIKFKDYYFKCPTTIENTSITDGS